MRHIDTADAVVVEPARPAAGTEKFFTNGDPGLGVPATVVPDWWANMIAKEIAAAIDLMGITHDKTDDGQLADAIQGAKVMRADSADTDLDIDRGGAGWNALIAATGRAHGTARGVIMATNGTAAGEITGSNALIAAAWDAGSTLLVSGSQSAIIASQGPITVSGDESATLAQDDATVSGDHSAAIAGVGGSLISANQSLVAAADNCDALDNTAAGLMIAILASEDCTADEKNNFIAAAFDCEVHADRAAVIAAENSDASGNASFVAASKGADAQGAMSAVIASGDSGDGVIVEKLRSAAVAARKSRVEVGTDAGSTLLVASERCALAEETTLGGGWHATTTPTYDGTSKNLTWRIDSRLGTLHYNGSLSAGTADYAEMFENPTGKPHSFGCLMTLEGAACRLAVKGDELLGIVSANPAIVGDAAPLEWRHRWIVDEWGARVTAEVPMISWDEVATEKRTLEVARAGYDGPLGAAGELPEDSEQYTVDHVVREAYRGPMGNLSIEGIVDANVFHVDEVRRPAYNGPFGLAPQPIPESAEYYERAIPRHVKRRTLRSALGRLLVSDGIPSVRWKAVKRKVVCVEWPAEITQVQRVRWPELKRRKVEKTVHVEAYNGPEKLAPSTLGHDVKRWDVVAPVENPDYDPHKPYQAPQSRRDDYTAVGLLGKLAVRYSGKLAVGDKIGPSDTPGLAVKASKGPIVLSITRAPKKGGTGVAVCLIR